MAGSKVNDYAIGDSNIESVMLTLDKAYKGLHQVSLTNYDSTSESQIAAGSVVENNGALYKFDANESITGSPSDGTVYIRLVPSADNITVEYTNTAPTWSDSKQGWYGTGADANKRYIDFVMNKSGSDWNLKERLTIDGHNMINEHLLYYASGSQTITTTATNVLYPTKSFDISNSNFNTSTGIYTVPEDGCYMINHRFSLATGTATGNILIYAGKNLNLLSDLSNVFIGSSSFFLRKDDEVYIATAGFSGTITVSSSFFIEIKKIN